LPSITGATTVGSTLTAATPGSWTADVPITYGYQWERCAGSSCQSIDGASGTSYILTATDAGDSIEVLVTATDVAGSGQEASAPVGPVANGALTRAGIARITRSLASAIAPRGHVKIAAVLRRGGYTGTISSLPAGRLRVSWSARERGGRSLQLAAAAVAILGTGSTKVRLVVSTRGRRALIAARQMRITARATLLTAGSPQIDAVTRFTLSR
jgi:hypothetical protein